MKKKKDESEEFEIKDGKMVLKKGTYYIKRKKKEKDKKESTFEFL